MTNQMGYFCDRVKAGCRGLQVAAGKATGGAHRLSLSLYKKNKKLFFFSYRGHLEIGKPTRNRPALDWRIREGEAVTLPDRKNMRFGSSCLSPTPAWL